MSRDQIYFLGIACGLSAVGFLTWTTEWGVVPPGRGHRQDPLWIVGTVVGTTGVGMLAVYLAGWIYYGACVLAELVEGRVRALAKKLFRSDGHSTEGEGGPSGAASSAHSVSPGRYRSARHFPDWGAEDCVAIYDADDAPSTEAIQAAICALAKEGAPSRSEAALPDCLIVTGSDVEMVRRVLGPLGPWVVLGAAPARC